MFKNRLIPCLMLVLASVGMHQHAVAQQSSAPGLKQRLESLLSGAKEDELLEPEKAFRAKATVKSPSTLAVELIPAKGYYLYKDRARFVLKDAGGAAIKTVKFPAGEIKDDRTFGRMEVFRKPFQVDIALDRAPTVKNMTLVVSYQGCHEKTGVCYPPGESVLNLSLPQ